MNDLILERLNDLQDNILKYYTFHNYIQVSNIKDFTDSLKLVLSIREKLLSEDYLSINVDDLIKLNDIYLKLTTNCKLLESQSKDRCRPTREHSELDIASVPYIEEPENEEAVEASEAVYKDLSKFLRFSETSIINANGIPPHLLATQS